MAGAHRATARATSAGVETLGGVGTAADIEALLRQVTPAAGAEGSGAGFTTGQLCDTLGLSEQAARKRLRLLLTAGLIEPCRVTVTNMAGSQQAVAGYRRVPATGAARRAQ